MRVLFLSNSIGGLKSFRMEFIEALLQRGDEVGICSPLEISPEVFTGLGCKILPIGLARHGMNPFTEIKTVLQYRKAIKRFQPDIILSYTIKPNIYGSLVAHYKKIPIINSVTGLGVALEKKGYLQMLGILLMKHTMKFADHVFFQNQDSINFFKRHNITLKSSSLVAGSGVNLDRFKLVPYPKEETIRFLYTGRILEEKGVRLYLEAAREIKCRYNNVEFHIVGIKDDVTISSMVEEYHKLGIINYHGYQSDPRPYVKMSHCQIHPTYYPEGMSNVLLESAAMGRPAITTDKTGCKEIVENYVTGLIIPQKDGKALISAIEKFLSLPYSDKYKMGLMAHNKVAKEFDRNLVMHQYLAKIEEII